MTKRVGNWNPGPHPRNTGPMMASLRCGARTRRGSACRSPATRDKARCRMHGGAKGSGAPLGNRNAWKHGRYATAIMAERKRFREFYTRMGDGLAAFKDQAFSDNEAPPTTNSNGRCPPIRSRACLS